MGIMVHGRKNTIEGQMMANRAFNKDAKVPGAGCGKWADWLQKKDVESFKILFDKVREDKGTYEAARKFVGVGHQVMADFKKGKLSAASGRKILDAYNKL